MGEMQLAFGASLSVRMFVETVSLSGLFEGETDYLIDTI